VGSSTGSGADDSGEAKAFHLGLPVRKRAELSDSRFKRLREGS